MSYASYALYNMVQSHVRPRGFGLYNEVWESTLLSELLTEKNVNQTVADFTDWTEDDDGWDWLETWRNRIASKVQAQQLADGIKVETVGESLGLS